MSGHTSVREVAAGLEKLAQEAASGEFSWAAAVHRAAEALRLYRTWRRDLLRDGFRVHILERNGAGEWREREFE